MPRCRASDLTACVSEHIRELCNDEDAGAPRLATVSHRPYAGCMRIAFAMLLALAATGACGQSSDRGGADAGVGVVSAEALQASLGDPKVRAKLRALALQAAGASLPQTMIAAASPDHQAAEKIISGDIVGDHSPVYVIELTGGPFTAGSSPPGVSAPQGRVLTLTVDAQSYHVMDVGITNDAPDLSQIGSVVVDLAQ